MIIHGEDGELHEFTGLSQIIQARLDEDIESGVHRHWCSMHLRLEECELKDCVTIESKPQVTVFLQPGTGSIKITNDIKKED